MPVTIQPTSLKYKNSNNEFQTVTAIKGDSPTVTVTDITNGHRVTITDTNGAHNFDVMDGEGHTLTAADKAEIVQQVVAEVDVPVQDVQVNGVSVLTDGVANVPLGTSKGLQFVGGVLQTEPAGPATVKSGANTRQPIVPYYQANSTFYGLAKAAGDTTQSQSSNAVGTYTNDAKVAIRNMIGALGTSNILGNGLYVSQDLETGNIYLGANVEDVQVNGTSVVSNGIANVPIASASNLGLVKTAGTGIFINSSGEMSTVKATSAQIKAATANFTPIVPSNQHESTFYGLAKVAGADMASSSNSVGTYTDEAKTAIRSMLGVQNFNPQSIAIIANGDTHAAITSGQYVYVQNHSTLTEGLYAASSAIAANEALSASNLTAVGSGGLNALLGKIPEQLIYLGTETNYPLSAAHTEYPIGITLIYTLSSTAYPYSMGTVITIRSAAARCLQLSFSNSPNDYKLRTADSDGWSDWKSLKDVPGITDLQKAIGIVVDGNKAATAVTLGQFVILKNTTISGKADGLYTAAKAIPANTAIDGTYLTSVSGGGLNSLKAMVADLNAVVVSWDSSYTPTRSDVAIVYKKGQTCQLIFWNVSWANEITTDTAVGTIPADFRPPEKTFFYGYNRLDQLCKGWLGTDGVIRISKFPGDMMYVSCTYLATY